VTFYVLGLASLIPWNFYVVSKRYFDYAFRDLNSTNTTSTLQTSFESYLAFITHIASLVIVIWNALHGYKLSLTKRLVFSLILQILLFVIILIFVDVDTDSCKHFNKIEFKVRN
jgi:solute carrier family 29 (equilibrative nucleoside transporter), member 1/2/3